jgi:hypothetical protein
MPTARATRRLPFATTPLAALLVGCGAGAPSDGGAPMVDGPGFFDRPFPSDARTVDGHPDLTGFPGEGVPLVDAYLAASASLDGFGTNSPIYVRFDGPVPVAALPSAEGSLADDAAAFLIDVDRDSPARGERVPLELTVFEDETDYLPGDLLAAAPLWGFPLRPATTYALVLRPPLAAVGPWSPSFGVGEDPALAETGETLRALGVDTGDVGLAVVFTTQDPIRETARIASAILRGEVGRPSLDQALRVVSETSAYTVYEGHVTVPDWQSGERPFSTEGGAFVFDDDGAPVVQHWERIRFTLSVPSGDMPDDGWPVVLYSHGTGGDDRTFCATGNEDDECVVLARRGLSVIGISQPLHADRAPPGTNVDFDTFNYVNPDAGRTNFRQGALDQVWMARLLADGADFTSGGARIALDPDRVGYMGHSQGGLVGGIAAPYLSGLVCGAVFSGAGGGLAMTVVRRQDPLDIAALLHALLGFEDDEAVVEHHPVVGLVQTLSEATDPINYAPHWFARAPRPGDLRPGVEPRPLPVLLTEGLQDAYTPSVTVEALASAARIPIVGTVASTSEAMRVLGLDAVPLPASANARDWNGDGVTAGLAQFPDDGHYAIYYNRDARTMYRDFLASALDGAPAIED